MKNPFLALLVTCIATLSGSAQSTKSSVLKFTDISVATGSQSLSGMGGTANFLLNQMASSDLIPGNIADYNSNDFYSVNGSSTLEISAGFGWRNTNNAAAPSNKRIRIGIAYSQPALMSENYNLNQSFAFDTLTSTRTGEEYYVDSLFNSNLGLNYQVSSLALNTAFLWTSNDLARWSFYGGVNLSAVIHIGAEIQANRFDFGSVGFDSPFGITYSNGFEADYSNQNERIAQPASFGFGFSAPLGVDWRIAKQGKSLNDLHLFAEVRPGVMLNNVANYGLLSQFSGTVLIGTRFSI